MPEDYLALDGNSLSTDDLRQLGKGRYKIRITKGLSMSNYPKLYLIISIQILFNLEKIALNHRCRDIFQTINIFTTKSNYSFYGY